MIFDVGGVITKTDFSDLYVNFAHAAGLDADTFVDLHKQYFKPMVLGEVSFEKFLNTMGVIEKDKIRELKAMWIDEALKVVVVDEDLLRLIDALRDNFKTAILTNLTESRLFVDERLDLYSHFDEVFLSYKEHLMKPDKAFYRVALKKLSIEPEEAIFVDDQERYIEAAKDLGMYGIAFKNTEQLKRELSILGVI